MFYEIETYKRVGPIHLGMTQTQIRNVLGGNVQSFVKNEYAPGDTDDFVDLGIHVHYSAKAICQAVEFAGIAIPTFAGKPLLRVPFEGLVDLIKPLDSALEIDETGFISRLLGFGVYISSMEDCSDPTEAVIVFEKGYYEQ